MSETRDDLREAPAVTTFAINRVGEEDICVDGFSRFVGEPEFLAYKAWAEAQVSTLQAEVGRLQKELSVEAPEEVLSPEWGRNAFSAVLGDGYTPKVWGKHRALHHSALREALELAADLPKVQDVIAWQIWRAVVDGNRSHHAFKMAAEAQERLQKVEGERGRLERDPSGPGSCPTGEAPDGSSSPSDGDPSRAAWMEDLDLSDHAINLINTEPQLLSLLYDLDLLPEQLLSQDEKTPGLIKAYHRLYGLLYAYMAFVRPPTGTAPCDRSGEAGETEGLDPQGESTVTGAARQAHIPHSLHTHPNPKREDTSGGAA